MAEFGVSPLVLTRGYAGGDEAKMLHRHLLHASVKIGVGANRRAIAASMLARYGHMDSSLTFHKLSRSHRFEPGQENEKIGVVILDDGMQFDAMGKQPLTSTRVFEGTIERTWASRYCRHPACRFDRCNLHFESHHLPNFGILLLGHKPEFMISKVDFSNRQTGYLVLEALSSPWFPQPWNEVSDAQLKVIESTVQKEIASVSIYFTS